MCAKQLPAITFSAENTAYDNSSSGLTADDVQEALDELTALISNENIFNRDSLTSTITTKEAEDTVDLTDNNLIISLLNGSETDITGAEAEATVAHLSDTDNPHSVTYAQVGAIEDTTDIIKNTHIDWGTGDGQVSTANVPENTNLYYTDARARAALSTTATGLTYTAATGVLSLIDNYVIPTTTDESNWDGAVSTIATYSSDWDSAYSQRVDTWGDGLNYSDQTASIDYNDTNLKITSAQINTIQDIDTSATPQFGGLALIKNDTTVYDDTQDDGQIAGGPTIRIANGDSTTTGSFAQIVFAVRSSNAAVGRIAYIMTGSASGAMAFMTENSNTKVEKMRILSSGEVGIGTKTPYSLLHVNGEFSCGDSVTSANSIRALNLCSTTAVARILRISANIDTAAPAIELMHRTSSNGADDSYWDLYTNSTGLNIRDRVVERTILTIEDAAPAGSFRLNSSGYIGINETAPDVLLHITSASGADGLEMLKLQRKSPSAANADYAELSYYLYNNAGTPEEIKYASIQGISKTITDGSEVGQLSFQTINGASTVTAAIMIPTLTYVAGRLNIGQAIGSWSTNSYSVDVYDSSSTPSGLGIYFADAGGHNMFMYKGSATDHDIYIGNTGAYSIQFETGLHSPLRMDGLNGFLTALPTYSKTITSNVRDLQIDDAGVIGYVASILASKTNIKEINPKYIQPLYELNPVSFNFRKQGKNGDYLKSYNEEINFGLIAEEVEKVFPELVFYDKTELAGVNYKKLIPLLLKAIQTQQQELNDIKKQCKIK